MQVQIPFLSTYWVRGIASLLGIAVNSEPKINPAGNDNLTSFNQFIVDVEFIINICKINTF